MSASPSSAPAAQVTWLHRAVGYIGYAYLQLIGLTSRHTLVKHPAATEWERGGNNCVYAFWHCKQAFLLYAYRGRKLSILVSMSKDGEYIARVIKRAGMTTVRGSSSRGGMKALLGLIAKTREGYSPVFTPDGPRGPAKTVQQGVIYLAKKTGLPVVPVSCATSRQIVFKSWDRFELPLPFSRTSVVEGEPLVIGADDSPEQSAERIKAALDAVTLQAEQLVSK